jgi:hypothetical protein
MQIITTVSFYDLSFTLALEGDLKKNCFPDSRLDSYRIIRSAVSVVPRRLSLAAAIAEGSVRAFTSVGFRRAVPG